MYNKRSSSADSRDKHKDQRRQSVYGQILARKWSESTHTQLSCNMCTPERSLKLTFRTNLKKNIYIQKVGYSFLHYLTAQSAYLSIYQIHLSAVLHIICRTYMRSEYVECNDQLRRRLDIYQIADSIDISDVIYACVR